MAPFAPRESASRRRELGSSPSSVWVLLGWVAVVACAEPEGEQLSCRDTLPPEQASFDSLTALVRDPLQGCTASGCHSGDTQQAGLRLDQPQLIYEEFASRPAQVYATLASGEMPEDGVRWDEAELRLFRSWYCNGAFPP